MKLLLAAISTAFISTSAFAIDLTFTEFGFGSQDSENLETSTVELGTRVGLSKSGDGQVMIEGYYWKETNDPEVGSSTEDSMLKVGGGYLRYFDSLGSSVEPYVGIGGYYLSGKEALSSEHSLKTNGIFYKGLLGLKINMSDSLFFVLESTLFENPLNSSAINTSTDKSYNETKFGVSSSSSFEDVEIGLGISF